MQFPVTLLLLLAALLASAARGEPSPSRLSLEKAVTEALASNLDLAARVRELEADRQQVDTERAALLPQIGVGARAQLIDSERSDDSRGNSSEHSVNVAAAVSQVLYDETDWASFRIQQHVYEGQTQQLVDFRLGVVQEAASAFLELDRNLALTRIHERNRELTASNLETTRARVAAGYSSDRELLRWQSQLAQNDQSVTGVRTQALVNRFELNRMRNRAREDPVELLPVEVEQYGFVYASEAIARAIAVPETDRRLRDRLVRLGAGRSPAIAAIDASIAAEERLVTANERSFWAPTLTALAGVDHLADSGNASDEFEDFEETEWMVRADVSFPLFAGGSKFSKLRQSREQLSGLRIARRAAVEAVDQQIRTAFAQAGGSFANIGFAARQEDAARRNYEFVNEGYVLGVAAILDLLDAQSQLLDAQIGSVNARYDFFQDLIAAERALAFFPFLEPQQEVDTVLMRLEQELRTGP